MLYRYCQEFLYSVRLLAKTPVATIVAVVSLSLGIGAITTTFSLVNAFVLRSLPVHDPSRLVSLVVINGKGNTEQRLSLAMFEDLEKQKSLFSDVFIWNGGALLNLEAGGVRFAGAVDAVSGGYFSTLGIKPLAGRFIGPPDVSLSGGTSSQIAVLSHACWQRQFDGNEHIVGQTIRLEDHPLTIVGIMPKQFSSLGLDYGTDVVVPLNYSGGFHAVKRNARTFSLYARLAPEVTFRQARLALETLSPRIARDSRLSAQQTRMEQIDIRSAATGNSYLRSRFSRPLSILMVLVSSVLLMACVNLANLMLARNAGRQHEISMRVALGASNWVLVRQLLLESLTLSGSGALLGLPVAFWASRLLALTMWNGYTPLTVSVTPDLRVFLFASAVAILIAVLTVIIPAITTLRTDPAFALNQSSHRVHGQLKIGKLLLCLQLCLSFVLVFGAASFVRSLHNLLTINPGFRRDHVLMSQLFPQAGQKSLIPNRAAYFQQLAEKLAHIPGASEASYSYYGPAAPFQLTLPVTSLSGAPNRAQAMEDIVGPGFFHLMQMQLLEGREFTWDDNEHSPRVAIISHSLARSLFPSKSPIGQMIKIGPQNDRVKVVGVVNSASLWQLQAREPLAYYTPLLQRLDYNQPVVDIRTSIEPSRLFATVGEIINRSKLQYALRTETLDLRTRKVLSSETTLTMLSTSLGGLALILAVIGLYGLMSYAVTRRTPEMGVRMSLGATPADVLRLIMREVALLVAASIVCGIFVVLVSVRLVAGMLFGLSSADPLTIALSVSLLVGVALVSGYGPARRASRVDPVSALRAE